MRRLLGQCAATSVLVLLQFATSAAAQSVFELSVRAPDASQAVLQLRGDAAPRRAEFNEGRAVFTDLPAERDQLMQVTVDFVPDRGSARQLQIPAISRVRREADVHLDLEFFSPPREGAAQQIEQRFPPDAALRRYLSARTTTSRLVRQVHAGTAYLGADIAALLRIWFLAFHDLSAEVGSAGNLRLVFDLELYRTLRCFEGRRQEWLLQRYVFNSPAVPARASFYQATDQLRRAGSQWWGDPCSGI
jgi:hypothetical protein